MFDDGLYSSAVLPPEPLDLRIAFVSTYPPKRCGIATFTKDLSTAINNINPNRLGEIIAMDDEFSEGLTYPWEVSRRIRMDHWSDYEKVLNYLNGSVIDMVSIQHEYGIFGRNDGEKLVKFVKDLNKPYIVTLHTILRNPSSRQKRIIQKISENALAVVVMLSTGKDILRDIYNMPNEKIVEIHHGTPDFPYNEDEDAKRKLGLTNKIVMSSINLLSRGKGIEYVLQGLPEVVKKYPNFQYLIIGQTHPVVVAREGEVYRKKLERLVKKYKLQKNVKFINKYVSLKELIEYVKASDLYITPYENMQQISSGALAYAVAAGRLCISTPYLYAREMLSGGRGVFIEPKDPKSISKAILAALDNPKNSALMRYKCYIQGRFMTWQRVAFSYLRLMDHVLRKGYKKHYIPKPSLAYLKHMTTRIGLLEHSKGDEKDYNEGYSVDDNARGLMVAVMYGDRPLANKYLEYLIRSEHEGKIYCDMGAEGNPVGNAGVGEWFGRSFAALAYTMRYGQTNVLRDKAETLISKLIPSCLEIKKVRPLVFIMLGLTYLEDLEWEQYQDERKEILEHCLKVVKDEYKKYASPDWQWLEQELRYDNCRVPQALIEVGKVYDMPEVTKIGLRMLNFILDNTYDLLGNHFHFVGNKGWYPKGGEKAPFDEQPIEAGSTVQACYAAYKVTNDVNYRLMAEKAFAWYHGDNIARYCMYDAEKESVYDGINLDNGHISINFNQGAESILEYLLAYRCYVELEIEQEVKYNARAYPTQ